MNLFGRWLMPAPTIKTKTLKIFFMTVYLNMKTSYGVETVDEFTRAADQKLKEFRAYVSTIVNEYHIAGMSVYRSSRPTKEWANKPA